MEEILKQIQSDIIEPLRKIDVIVDSVDWVVEGKNKYLQVTLDKVNGIDIDTIVKATKIINPILDEKDLIKEEYILDVSSKERG